MITRHTEASPKALNASGLSIRPIWEYDEHFDRAADEAFFLEKHGGSSPWINRKPKPKPKTEVA